MSELEQYKKALDTANDRIREARRRMKQLVTIIESDSKKINEQKTRIEQLESDLGFWIKIARRWKVSGDESTDKLDHAYEVLDKLLKERGIKRRKHD